VSGKGNIKFIVPEEKGPGKMLQKWRKRGRGRKERQEKQRARKKAESAIFLASVKNNLNKVMGQSERQSISRRFKSEGELKPERCSNVNEQKENEDWKLIQYVQHTPKTTRVKEESKMSQKQLLEAI
jgi:hypothetical protein